jgi:hypothetical protein
LTLSVLRSCLRGTFTALPASADRHWWLRPLPVTRCSCGSLKGPLVKLNTARVGRSCACYPAGMLHRVFLFPLLVLPAIHATVHLLPSLPGSVSPGAMQVDAREISISLVPPVPQPRISHRRLSPSSGRTQRRLFTLRLWVGHTMKYRIGSPIEVRSFAPVRDISHEVNPVGKG